MVCWSFPRSGDPLLRSTASTIHSGVSVRSCLFFHGTGFSLLPVLSNKARTSSFDFQEVSFASFVTFPIFKTSSI
jgi:hypothetical protein